MGGVLRPLPKSRYWPESFGPPNPNLEQHLLADLARPEYRPHRTALEQLTSAPKLFQDLESEGITRETLTDLRDNGLVFNGLNLEKAQRTYKLTGLGILVQDQLKADEARA